MTEAWRSDRQPSVRDRMPSSWRDGIAILGAAAILAYTVYRLPPASELLRLPRTPIDRSKIHASAAEYRLLIEAARLVPAGATVLVRGAAPDPERDGYLHRFGVALLPGRRVLPAFVDGLALPHELEASVDYFVVVGPVSPLDGAELLLTTGDGSLWRRIRP